MLGLRFCARAFSSCGERGPLFIAVRRPLTIVASLVAEHRLQTRRLSNCGSRAQLLRGMWDLPRPGLEPVSPALAGGFSTTAPPGKPLNVFNTGKWAANKLSPRTLKIQKQLCYLLSSPPTSHVSRNDSKKYNFCFFFLEIEFLEKKTLNCPS